MKLTLLQLVQRILQVTDGEDVSDVGETDDAAVGVLIVNRAYEYMATHSRWRHFRRYTILESAAALNELGTPDGTFSFNRNMMYYAGNRLTYLLPEEFIAMTISRDTSESNIEEITSNYIKVYNDRNPVYFTSINDDDLVFDAIPDSINGLLTSDSRAMLYVAPTAVLQSNSEVFDLPAIAFPALELLCESFAFEDLRGDTDASSKAFKQFQIKMSRLSREARVIDPPDDVRRNIVPRRSSRRLRGDLRYFGNGVVW